MWQRVVVYCAVLVSVVGMSWYWHTQSQVIAQKVAQLPQPYVQIDEWVERAAEENAAQNGVEFVADVKLIDEFPGAAEAMVYEPTVEELRVVDQMNGPRLPDVDTTQPVSGEELRIGFINDFQLGASGKIFPDKDVRVVKAKYLTRINYFLAQMHASFRPHFMISPGDIIEGTNRDTPVGITELRAVKYLFDSRSNIPMYWALGNHELRSVTMAQFLDAMDMDSRRYSFDISNYRVIVTGANYDELGRIPIPKHGYIRGNFAARELLWIERELRKAQDDGKIILVFSHQPPLAQIEGKSDSGLPRHADEAEKLFAYYDVAAVFSGHIEKNFSKEVDGVKYFGTTGIKKSPDNLGTYAQVVMNGRDASVELFYIDNATGKYVSEWLGQ